MYKEMYIIIIYMHVYVAMQVTYINYTYNYIIIHTVEPVHYGHLGTNQRCQDYAGVHIFKCPD